jgi:hypothetical protein
MFRVVPKSPPEEACKTSTDEKLEQRDDKNTKSGGETAEELG